VTFSPQATYTYWPIADSRRILVPTFGGYKDVSWSTNILPTAVNPRFLDRSHYILFQVAPQLSSWGWVDPITDPPLLGKCGSAGNRTRDLWLQPGSLTTRPQKRCLKDCHWCTLTTSEVFTSTRQAGVQNVLHFNWGMVCNRRRMGNWRDWTLHISRHFSFILVYTVWPPLWSSGKSSWLLNQRSRVRFQALPNFLDSTGSGTGSI
jgi:hypothetical protein